jgi:hypothetical protein
VWGAAAQHNSRNSAGWLANFALESAASGGIGFRDPTRQLIFSVLRRVDCAVLEYDRGRDALTEFIECRGGISQYSRCLHAFETAVAMAYQGRELANQLSTQLQKELPSAELEGEFPSMKKEAEIRRLLEHRIDRVHNASKHAAGFIANRHFARESTLSVWITNEGLKSREGRKNRECLLKFTELAGEIEQLGSLAEMFSFSLEVDPDKF